MLAGGSGSRLGGTKPLARLGGRPLISYPLAAALASGHETLVIAKRRFPLPALVPGCQVAYEPDLPQHPLRGIVTALTHAAGRPVIVVGCDMPFLTARLLAWLAEIPAASSVVTVIGGRPQPLLARYAPRDLPALEGALHEQAPLRQTVRALMPRSIAEAELRRFGDPRTLCFNVNDPADLAQAEELLRDRASSSLAVSSSASETATSSADSASAPEKSVAKRP